MVNNSEVDLTKKCYQIWHKVTKVAKKCYHKWQKVANVKKKGSTISKETLCVPTTQAMATLPVFKKVSSIALL